MRATRARTWTATSCRRWCGTSARCRTPSAACATCATSRARRPCTATIRRSGGRCRRRRRRWCDATPATRGSVRLDDGDPVGAQRLVDVAPPAVLAAIGLRLHALGPPPLAHAAIDEDRGVLADAHVLHGL